jgi:hypothetical protein
MISASLKHLSCIQVSLIIDRGAPQRKGFQTMSDSQGGVTLFRRILTVLSVIWVVWIGSYAYERWPVMPLDVAATDKATRDAYENAVLRHITRSATLASIGPLVSLLLGYVFSPKRNK